MRMNMLTADHLMLPGYDEYKAVVAPLMCKAQRGDSWNPEYISAVPAEFIRSCYLVAGEPEAAAMLVNPPEDETPWWYKEDMPEGWESFDYDENFELQNHDWLVWSWSEDGTELPNRKPLGALDGNVTGGFLIEASGDFPTVWQSHDPVVLGGIYPLEVCMNDLRKQLHANENLKGRLAWVFRFKFRRANKDEWASQEMVL